MSRSLVLLLKLSVFFVLVSLVNADGLLHRWEYASQSEERDIELIGALLFNIFVVLLVLCCCICCCIVSTRRKRFKQAPPVTVHVQHGHPSAPQPYGFATYPQSAGYHPANQGV
ncbi:unnamed protein product, partial [Mesorhabditis belari]|uniref:Uncharacterized protein n=1 Tax=Mesorhabditis belari TaxID=2138241 RepID=A0AAF3ECB2_9BILA